MSYYHIPCVWIADSNYHLDDLIHYYLTLSYIIYSLNHLNLLIIGIIHSFQGVDLPSPADPQQGTPLLPALGHAGTQISSGIGLAPLASARESYVKYL